MNETIKSFCVDFVLPAMVLVICTVLLVSGIDGEVKTILAGAAGWLFKSGYARHKAS